VLFNCPSRYLFAIGLTPVFSLGGRLPAGFGLQSQAALLWEKNGGGYRRRSARATYGAFTLHGASFQRTCARSLIAGDTPPNPTIRAGLVVRNTMCAAHPA